jgi:biofilm PGA synthesis protein PgaA
MKSNSVWMLLLIASSVAGAAQAADEGKNYDELLSQARRGDYAPLLQALGDTVLQGRALNDYLAVADWAGKGSDVIRAYEAYGRGTELPSYALLPVARAYRDDQRWAEALTVFEEGARRFPEEPSFAQGVAMTLADAGQLDAALQRAQALVQAHPDDADNRLTLAYVHVARGQFFEALSETDRANGLAPGRDYVAREYILALRRTRMAGPALRAAQARPGVVDAALMRTLEGDAAAELARVAALPARGEAERYTVADRALARYDDLLARWNALQPRPEEDIRRARIDRIAALHARGRMQQIIAEYEALSAEGEVPVYALSDVASAYLHERQPEMARDIYEQSLRFTAVSGSEEARHEDETGLYFALIESEDFDRADEVVRALQARHPVWLNGGDAPAPNELRLSADQLAASALLYANDTRGAHQALAAMVEKAPNNTGLLTGLAQVQRARALPRESEVTLKVAETLSPSNGGVMLGQGATALALQEWAQAEQLRDDLVQRFPQDRGVLRLARDVELHHMTEVRVNAYRGLEAGNPVLGSRERGMDIVAYSPPMGEQWRAFVGGGAAGSTFEEGRARYRWVRGGAQWRGRDLTVEGEVSAHRYGHGTKTGVSLTGAYDIDDHWQVGGGAALHTRATPLRALHNGIHADRIDAFVRWRADELREWRLGLAPSRFSDGNNRTELLLQGSERLYTAPHFWADALLEVGASNNSRIDGAPYFNPRADHSVLPAVRLSQMLYRRYETVWEHQLTLGAGVYAQRGYGSGGIRMWSYGQRFRTNDVFELGASVSGQKRPYDGVRERSLRFDLDMTFRF